MNRKIRILFTIGTFTVGGKERQMAEIIKNLPIDKYEIYLFAKNNGHWSVVEPSDTQAVYVQPHYKLGTLVPNVLETWELYGCFIKSANYNNMDYKSNDPATIQLSVRFDNAIQSPLSSGLGTQVGRAFGGLAATGLGK